MAHVYQRNHTVLPATHTRTIPACPAARRHRHRPALIAPHTHKGMVRLSCPRWLANDNLLLSQWI